jgi:putative DNA primase/helicase
VRGLSGQPNPIDATGRKSFPRGGKLQGGHFTIGVMDKTETLLITEGYATGATLHALTGLAVVVAFNSGNLPAVAQDYRAKHPEQLILIAGDNDHQKPQDKNVGANKALEAAQLVGGYPMLPDFKANEKGTDWNDLVKIKGLEGAKYRVMLAIETAKKRHADKQHSTQHQAVALKREGHSRSR